MIQPMPSDRRLGTLKIPEEKFDDHEKTVYTEYTPLGVCGGMYLLILKKTRY